MIFSVYLIDKGESFSTTNMVSLAGIIGMSYGFLVRHFTRDRKNFYMDDKMVIIRSEELIRGRQSPPDKFKFES